jgi:hypothetical protein
VRVKRTGRRYAVVEEPRTVAQLVLDEYTGHYNVCRPHRALRQKPPAGRAHPPVEVTGMRILRRDRLGGLIHEYSQVA